MVRKEVGGRERAAARLLHLRVVGGDEGREVQRAAVLHVRDDEAARAYLASYCHATGVKPSLLAEAAAACAPHWDEAPLPPSSHAAAMLHEMADHIS